MNLFVNGILVLTTLLASLLLLLLPHTEASLAHGVYKNEAHPGKCYIAADLILSSGQSANYPGSECAGIMCGDNSAATISTCGVLAGPPNCKLGPYPSADYPECCNRKFICDK